MTRTSANAQLYTVRQTALPTAETHANKTGAGLAFPGPISGMNPTSIRAEGMGSRGAEVRQDQIRGGVNMAKRRAFCEQRHAGYLSSSQCVRLLRRGCSMYLGTYTEFSQ